MSGRLTVSCNAERRKSKFTTVSELVSQLACAEAQLTKRVRSLSVSLPN